MVHLLNKFTHPLLAAVLVLAIMGIFVFTRVETPHAIESNGKKPNLDTVVTTVAHTIDWLAESTIIINRTKRAPSLNLRYGMPRLLLFFEIHNANKYIASFTTYTANPDYSLNVKNTILLKLRI